MHQAKNLSEQAHQQSETLSNKKVFLTANSTWNVVNFRLGLIRALQSKGMDVIVAAPADRDPEPLRKIGCHFVQINLDRSSSSIYGDAALLYSYRSLLKRERPSVVLGFTVKPNIYASLAAASLGIPVINNISGLGTAFIHRGLVSSIVKYLYRISLARSHCVFFQNPDDRQLFLDLKLVGQSRAATLPGSGVDLDRFSPCEDLKVEHRSSFTFLLIGRLLWDKGVGEFVEAARLVKADHPDANFQMLGPLDPQNRTAIKEESIKRWCEEGVITYLGSADDVRPHIASSDCVVLPSYREGTPRSLLEAAAMARPLIATDVPGCREVTSDGVNGLLCRARDATDLARAMRRMLTMEPSIRAAMGRAGRVKIVKEFSENTVIERYLVAINALGQES